MLFDLCKAFESRPERPIFLRTRSTCPELPSNISTIISMQRWKPHISTMHEKKKIISNEKKCEFNLKFSLTSILSKLIMFRHGFETLIKIVTQNTLCACVGKQVL